MTISYRPEDIMQLRLRSLLLTPNNLNSPADVTEYLFAIQGQDFDAARWALALRAGIPAKPASQAAISKAFNSGEIVRSWPMRGTVHLMRAEDIGWMQELTNPSILRTWPKRRENLEIELSVYERAREIALGTLEGGKSITRGNLLELWRECGIEMQQGWSYHFIWALCQHGDIVFGPMNKSGDLELVLASEWIKNPNQYDEDEAYAEFCVRYFTGHGPATIKDLMWWSQLPARALKAGIKLAGERLAEITADGEIYYAIPEQLEGYSPAKPTGELLALTPFDEHLLGYKDRSLFVDPKNARKVMTINGIAQPTIVRDGRVVATWKVRDGSYEVLEDERLLKRELGTTEAKIQEVRTWLGRV